MFALLPHVVIIVASLLGIAIAAYIRYKKTAHQVLVCPLHSNCEAVTHSEFSYFLGIPVELLGIAYYGLTAASYSLFIVVPWLAGSYSIFALLVLSTAAFMFSMYLTFIQAFTLKQWCTWCLFSAGLCTLIFGMAIQGAEGGFLELLRTNHAIILGLHLLGVVLGVGGATITDVFFFKFIKDFKISHDEAAVMNAISQIIWLALAILILSGIGLYLPEMERLNHSSKFLLKMVVVGVIILNGACLNLLIAPRLVHIVFGGPLHHRSGNLRLLRKVAYALGAISITSWYTAFILGLTPSLPLSFTQLLLLFGALLIAAVVGSQITEWIMLRKKDSGGSTAIPAQARSPY